MPRGSFPIFTDRRSTGRPALLIVFLLLLGAPPPYAQPAPDSLAAAPPTARSGPWVPPLRDLGENALDVVRGPFALSAAERRLALGTTGALLGLAAAFDEPAYRHMSERAGTESAAFRATASLARPGEWYDRRSADRLALCTVGVLAGSGIVLRTPVLTRTSVRVMEALLYTDLVVGFTKSVINRARPYVGTAPDAFAADPGAFSGDHTKLAMPSGHAGRVFAIASVLSHQADRWYVSVPLYAGAASVGVERVRSGDHWLTDVVVGGAMGYLVGRSVVPRSASASEAGADGVHYRPLLSAQRLGVSVVF